MTRQPRYPQVCAAIIAGGQGRRMGGLTKALIEVDGVPIIERQLDVLGSLVADVCIVADDPAPFLDYGTVIPDRISDRGPLGGIAAALAWTEQPWVLAIASDMPYLSAAALSVLLDACGEAVDDSVDIVAVNGQPLCAVYSKRCLAELDRRIGGSEQQLLRASGLLRDAKLRVALIDRQAFALVDRELRFLSNINSPIDLRS